MQIRVASRSPLQSKDFDDANEVEAANVLGVGWNSIESIIIGLFEKIK